MSKMNFKLYLFVISAVLILILTALFLPLLFLENTIKNAENNKLSTNENITLPGFTGEYDFEKYYNEFYSRYEFIKTSLNPLEPVITILKEDQDTGFLTCSVYAFKRVGFTDFKVDKYIYCSIQNYSFEKARSLLNDKNLIEDNPDIQNIQIGSIKKDSANFSSKELPENMQKRFSNLSSSNQEKFIKYYLIQKYTEQYNQKDAEDYLTELEKNNIPDTFDSAENIFNQHR